MEPKVEDGRICRLCARSETRLPFPALTGAYAISPWSQAFGCGPNHVTGFLVLQRANGRMWDSLVLSPREPIPIPTHLLFCLSSSYPFCFISPENTD